MRKLLVALLVLPFAQTAGSAQTAGDAAAGKAYWDRLAPRLTDCKDCHGLNGEGGFGPDLAGRGLNAAQIERAVRQPWGVMPAFVESQVSAKDAADLAAYFATLPKPAQPGKWRVEVPAGAPPGQATMIYMGCGECQAPRWPAGEQFGRVQCRFRFLRQPGLQPYDGDAAIPRRTRAKCHEPGYGQFFQVAADDGAIAPNLLLGA